MNKNIILIIVLVMFLSCNREAKNTTPKGSSELNLKAEALEYAVTFAMGKFTEPGKSVDKSGIITISDKKISLLVEPVSYVIGLSSVTTGFIDDDQYPDAIVSIASYKGQYLIPAEHLFLMGSEGKLQLSRAVESDMRVLGIKDKVIITEIRTHPPGSPLYNCDSCKEVIKYQFRQGELIRVE